MTKEREDQLIDAIVGLKRRESELLFELDEVRDAIEMMEEELRHQGEQE